MSVCGCAIKQKGNDFGIWNKTTLLQGIQNGSFEPPDDEKLSNSETLLRDDAFAFERFIIKPFPQQGLAAEKRIYNYRHSTAQKISKICLEF